MITICSANLGTSSYLNLNWDLTVAALGRRPRWIVSDNDAPEITAIAGVSPLDPGFEVVEGVSKYYCIPRAQQLRVGANNVQHGLSLNNAVKKAIEYGDRYLLLLDPDFFIIPSLDTVIEYMQKKGLAYFGAPYLSETPLVHNCPVAFCLFIDMEKRIPGPLNFEPGYFAPDDQVYPDVGCKVYQQFIDQPKLYDIALPSIPEGSELSWLNLRHTKSRFRVSYDNPANDKHTKIDEYFWKNDQPFGLHTRGKLNQARNQHKSRVDRQLETARKVVTKSRTSIGLS